MDRLRLLSIIGSCRILLLPVNKWLYQMDVIAGTSDKTGAELLKKLFFIFFNLCFFQESNKLYVL